MALLIQRLLFIVRADRIELYESLRRTFDGDDTVEIVRDRRQAERRRGRRGAAAPEHRRRERRKSSELDRQLRTRGYAVVGVTAPGPPFPSASAPGGTVLS